MMELIGNPSMIKKPNAEKLYYSYRVPIRRKLIVMDEDMIILKEPIWGESNYRKLRIVPRDLRQIVFIEFHANPIGGHFGLHNTVVRIRLRFFWQGLYTYCKNMISKCAGCTLSGAMTSPSKELVYGFPIDGHMEVLHVDGFTVGASIHYACDKGFLVSTCGMCTYAVADPVPESNSTTYAQAM